MTTAYREKLIAEIQAVPDAELPKFYRVVHTIREQFLPLRYKRGIAAIRQFGSAKGQVWIADDFNDPLPEEIVNAFYK
jgi:hypothetical protein